MEGAAELEVETEEAVTSPESPPTQIETATLVDTPLPPTEAATPTESQPTPVESASPAELQPTPVIPFTAESIGPGQQEAYSFQSSSGEEVIFWLYLPEDYDEGQTWPLIISLHGFLGF